MQKVHYFLVFFLCYLFNEEKIVFLPVHAVDVPSNSWRIDPPSCNNSMAQKKLLAGKVSEHVSARRQEGHPRGILLHMFLIVFSAVWAGSCWEQDGGLTGP